MKVGKALSLLVGSLVLLVVAVFIHSRGTLDFRNDEEKIRGVVADFIEACQERDLDDIWDLHSDAWHREGMSVCRSECRREV